MFASSKVSDQHSIALMADTRNSYQRKFELCKIMIRYCINTKYIMVEKKKRTNLILLRINLSKSVLVIKIAKYLDISAMYCGFLQQTLSDVPFSKRSPLTPPERVIRLLKKAVVHGWNIQVFISCVWITKLNSIMILLSPQFYLKINEMPLLKILLCFHSLLNAKSHPSPATKVPVNLRIVVIWWLDTRATQIYYVVFYAYASNLFN